MANDHGQNSVHKEPRRRPGMLGGAPALAEEGDVAFGGMAGMGVIAAIIVSMLALAGAFSYQSNNGDDRSVAAVPEDETEDVEPVVEDEEAAETEADEKVRGRRRSSRAGGGGGGARGDAGRRSR